MKFTTKKETDQMFTIKQIKQWAADNQIDGYESAYKTAATAIEQQATYKRGGVHHGIPAVIPTKARAAANTADYWSGVRGEFAQQVVYIARALEAHYTSRGI